MGATIAAIATPLGRGGVGIVRISGSKSSFIAQALLGQCPQPRTAVFSRFKNAKGDVLDQGIALFFKAPHSFTGEDILELQGHGGPLVMDQLLKAVIQRGARLARPGEFSQRAFLNGKLDLSQAEAVADLINAGSEKALRSAMQSLQGVFSKKISVLLEQLTRLRVLVEAAIDFSEEEINFIEESTIISDLEHLLEQLKAIKSSAKQGVLLQEGLKVVIAGKPNVGKSSLLNVLTERDSAIVTDIPGTTRDRVEESIQIDGLPIHIIDTAGIHDTSDIVEQEGVRRAQEAIHQADLVLWVEDISNELEERKLIFSSHRPMLIVRNKIDLLAQKPRVYENKNETTLYLSVKTGEGLDLLRHYLKKFCEFEDNEGSFMARRRHLDALERCCLLIQQGLVQIQQQQALELLAEELRGAQNALSEITGQFTTDDLLGEIFSTFCIGK